MTRRVRVLQSNFSSPLVLASLTMWIVLLVHICVQGSIKRGGKHFDGWQV